MRRVSAELVKNMLGNSVLSFKKNSDAIKALQDCHEKFMQVTTDVAHVSYDIDSKLKTKIEAVAKKMGSLEAELKDTIKELEHEG